MYYRKKISFILLILFFSYYAFADIQSEKSPEPSRTIDSLEKEYNVHLKQQREDTATINILKKIAKIYFNQEKIAKIYFSQNPLKALDYYHKALEIAKKIDNKSEFASLHYNIGQVYREQGIYDLSIESFLKCLKINKELGEKVSVGWCYVDIGNIYYSMEIYKTSWKYYEKAINIFNEFNLINASAVSFNNLALICIRKNNNDSALLYFNKALKIREKQNNKYLIAHSYNYIARIYKNTGQYEKALDIYNNAYNLYNEINNKSGVSEVLISIGRVYEKQNKYKQAIQKYKQSLFIYEEIGDNLGMAFSHYRIASIYYLQNMYRQTIEYSTKSLNIALENGLLIEEKDAYNLLSKAYLSSGNYKQAFNYLNKYFTIKDSIYSENVIKKINNQEFRIELEKKENEIELLIKDKALNESEIKKQKIVKYSFIIGFVLILIIVFIIYNRYKLKKKANEQLAGRNAEITKQKEVISIQIDQISLQKKEITDSIVYAKQIQQAILPQQEYLNKELLEHFILFKPRDILSGDFYWLMQKENKTIVAAVDCTGHGVPGAFMSMLGISFLNEIMSETNLMKANEILNKLREYIMKSLHQTGKVGEAQDGMDIALCILDLKSNKLQYSGANNPLYLIRNVETKHASSLQATNNPQLIEIKPDLSAFGRHRLAAGDTVTEGSKNEKHILYEVKADKMPIGIHTVAKIADLPSFTNNEIKLTKGDTIYLFSDGYVDQFGGPNGKKFKSKQFKQLLVDIHKKDMTEQKAILDKTIEDWKGNIEQIDDILIMGIRI